MFWKLLGKVAFNLLLGGLLLIFSVILLTYAVGVILALLSPFFQYPLFLANLAGLGWVLCCALLVLAVVMLLIEIWEGNTPVLPTWLKKGVEDTSPPSLLSIWWTSVKEKTCVKIVVSSAKD